MNLKKLLKIIGGIGVIMGILMLSPVALDMVFAGGNASEADVLRARIQAYGDCHEILGEAKDIPLGNTREFIDAKQKELNSQANLMRGKL